MNRAVKVWLKVMIKGFAEAPPLQSVHAGRKNEAQPQAL